MKKLLEINHVTINDNKALLLDEVDLSFYENVNTFICGTSASGKTLLLKAIANQVKYEGEILKDDLVKVVFDRNIFFSNTVEDEVRYLALDEEQKQEILEFIPKELLNNNPNELEWQMKKMVLIFKALMEKPKLLIIDQVLSFLEKENVQKILCYAKNHNITIVNISNEIEDALDYEYMVVLDKGKVAIEGKTLQVLEQERLLKRLGIGLPFYVDLSLQLKLYGLVDKVYLSKEELVGALWK